VDAPPGLAAGATPVSHAAVLYNRERPAVGALFNVYTDPRHRRKGISTELVRRALADFDAAGGAYCVLGTGSPHAAKVYRREGFVAAAGSLDGKGPVGYNPDDTGELIMIRTSPGHPPFAAPDFYAVSDNTLFEVEAVDRGHFCELALLFFANDGAAVLAVLGIESGILAEEPLTALACQIADGIVSASVAVAVLQPGSTRRVHGLRVVRAADGATGSYVYPGRAAARVRAALA